MSATFDRLHVLLATFLCIAVAACSGNVAPDDGGFSASDGGVDAETPSDSGTLDALDALDARDAHSARDGAPIACPVAMPAAGESCEVEGQNCSYATGNQDPCSTHAFGAKCEDGVWKRWSSAPAPCDAGAKK